jgi:hypothetical protein
MPRPFALEDATIEIPHRLAALCVALFFVPILADPEMRGSAISSFTPAHF